MFLKLILKINIIYIFIENLCFVLLFRMFSFYSFEFRIKTT